jgi:hypothetical protein
MHILNSRNKIKTHYIVFTAYFINRYNLNNIQIKIHLIKNHYRHLWNNWANRLSEIFLLLPDHEAGK